MLKRALRKALRSAGKELLSIEELEAYQNELKFYRSLNNASLLYSQLPQEKRELIAPYLPYSKAQLAQDLFALAFTQSTAPGFFVEFGATDGVSHSNTWLLEKKLGWTGILAEPAKVWHDELSQNRTCILDTRCVAKASYLTYQFLEVATSAKGAAVLSSIESYADSGDWASNIRLNNSTRYEVETISLNDLLDQHNAPETIQFLSLDTEGSELEILEGYNFKDRNILCLCVEHNYANETRLKINRLLGSKGYKQVLPRVSKWDDWYVLGGDCEPMEALAHGPAADLNWR